ncbi:trypsin-like serine peptidase [Streptomyces sp. bgisy100]|uniref:trypsin-like serine peptidase n=1 Tax=Streptomyces sp. bgisy100 TaxID=3413783 RepID=UPI003D728281
MPQTSMPRTSTPWTSAPWTSASVIRRLRGRALALAAAGTALALAAPIPATALAGRARPAAADPVSVLSYTAKERKDALAYWTPARMKAVGKSVDLGPTGPKAKPWQGTAMKTVGRLFFVNANGADTWCTATAVKSANRSAVMTAAHCVRRGSSPHNTNILMVFVPGYSKGKAPYGAFAVRGAATPRTWENDSTDDLSTLVVDPDKGGRKLTDVVGGQDIAFNRPVGGTVSAFGYSATRPQLGEQLLHCVGTPKEKDGLQAIPCDMSGGSSGGPWLADFNATTGKGVLVSVNSALDSLTPTEMQGELLGATAEKVYDRAQNG